MTANKGRTIVVTGATGLQGGAVARQLPASGWGVRALTLHPWSPDKDSVWRRHPARSLLANFG